MYSSRRGLRRTGSVSRTEQATNDADTTNHMADEDRRDLAKIFIQTNALPILNLEGENSDSGKGEESV